MNELIGAVVAMSWPLLVSGGLAGRRRSVGMVSLLIALVVAGGGLLGALSPADAIHLPQWTGLGGAMLSLLLWAMLGMLARAAGGVSLPGPPLLTAIAAGALMGEIGAAAMIAGMADKRAAARLALAAAGGALIGRVGDPALVLLFEPVGWSLAPLGLLLALVAAPGVPLPRLEGRPLVTGVAALVALAAALSGVWLPHVLAAGCVVMAVLAGERVRSVELKPVALVGGLVVLSMLATASGLTELAAWGIEYVQESLGVLLLPVLTAAGALVSLLADGTAGALLGAAIVDRALDLRVTGVPAALAAGLAVGGLTPLLMVGAVREGLPRWMLQVLLAVLWAGLVL